MIKKIIFVLCFIFVNFILASNINSEKAYAASGALHTNFCNNNSGTYWQVSSRMKYLETGAWGAWKNVWTDNPNTGPIYIAHIDYCSGYNYYGGVSWGTHNTASQYEWKTACVDPGGTYSGNPVAGGASVYYQNVNISCIRNGSPWSMYAGCGSPNNHGYVAWNTVCPANTTSYCIGSGVIDAASGACTAGDTCNGTCHKAKRIYCAASGYCSSTTVTNNSCTTGCGGGGSNPPPPPPTGCTDANCNGPTTYACSGCGASATCEQWTYACRGTPLTCTNGPHAGVALSNCGSSCGDACPSTCPTTAPTGLSPANGTTYPAGTTQATIDWNPVPGAAWYNIRVTDGVGDVYDSRNSCTTNIPYVCINNNGGATNFTFAVRNGRTYSWTIIPNNTGCGGGPTGGGSFSVGSAPPPPPICNGGIECDVDCTATTGSCGSGTKTCTYTTYSGGGACTQKSAPNQTCTIGCSAGSSCISNACVCDTPAAPTGLAPSGNISAGIRNITWNAVAGVTTYALRIDDSVNDWNGLCSGAQNPGDVCDNNVTGTSYSFNFIAGHSYHIWVHAINATCGRYSPPPETWPIAYTNVVGQVYIDYNGNGANDSPPDTGYAGVKVTLSNGQTATTDSGGNYIISNVLPNTYTESIVIPNGYTLKYPIPYPPTVYAYSPNITQNFGIQPPPPVCNPNSLTTAPSTVYVGGSNSTLTAGPCVPGGGAPGSVTYTWSPVSPGNVANINSNVTVYTPPAAGSTYTQTVVYPSVQVCNPGALGVASACTNLGTSITVVPRFSIDGNVFVDQNKDKLQNGSDANYTDGISISPNPTGATVTYNAGNYLISGLIDGTYTIYYNGPPVGYQMTYPQTIPPPSFSIRVGNASTGGACLENSNSASCDANGNITALRYGITNSIPWIQTTGGDPYFGNGISNPIPAGATCGPYMSLQGGGGTPGIVYIGNGSANLGSGQASPNPYNWIVGGLTYPEIYKLPSNVIRTSYNYVSSIAKQSGITPTDIKDYCGAGGISNCALSGTLANGVYIANGLTINSMSQSNTFSANRDIVILVNGDLNINTEIHVPTTSTAFFTASGNINVDSSVGNSDITLTTANIQGYYSADKKFIVHSLDADGKGLNCPTSDKRLNVSGSIVVNAALNGGSLTNNRDLCAGDLQCPAFSITERPDFILNAPDFFKTTRRVWQEIAP